MGPQAFPKCTSSVAICTGKFCWQHALAWWPCSLRLSQTRAHRMTAAASAEAIAKHHSLCACVLQVTAARLEGAALSMAAMKITAASAQVGISVATGIREQAA